MTNIEEIMPTNLAIDDKLIENAKRIGKHKTKKSVVTEALIEYIQRREQLEILNLFGTIEYDEDYDYKDQRKRD
jgi:Arc/MetJ family transcription regulator